MFVVQLRELLLSLTQVLPIHEVLILMEIVKRRWLNFLWDADLKMLSYYKLTLVHTQF